MNIKGAMPSPFPHGQVHLPDDDNTFAPPALSAYSIALLSDAPLDPSPVTGLNSVPLKENPQLRNSLKSKLSVHFQGDASVDQSANNVNVGSHNVSGHNLSSHNLSGHNLSNHSTSGHSMNQSTSNTSFSSSSNLQQDDDLMDMSAETLAKSLHSLSTTPGGSMTLASLLARPLSSGYSGVKRSRLTRRFNALGPPKRASEYPDPPEDIQSLPADQDGINNLPSAAPQADSDSTERAARPKRSLSISPILNTSSNPGRRTVSTSSDFFKSLQKLQERSPSLKKNGIRIDSAGFDFLILSSHNSESQHENGPGLHSKRTFQKSATSRVPLHSISPNIHNMHQSASDFRKPRTPKAYPGDVAPSLHSKISPPSIASAQGISNYSDYPLRDTSLDDNKKRKIIQINSQQYEKLELLGRGGTSKVYKVRSLTTKLSFAIKKVSFDQFDETCVKGFKGEIDLLTKLKDEPRVVKLMDHTISDGSIFLVMECGDSDLARVLQTKLHLEKKLDINFVKFHSMEILRCVEAVHRAGIVHSDLKPANFLFVKGVMKIIDFGIANAVPDHTANIYRESQIGTPNYMAPEALVEVNHALTVTKNSSNGGNTWKVGRPSDIWSCGCIIYQMIYGKPPYGSYSGQLRIMAIMNPQVKIEFPSRGIGGVPVPYSSIELMQMCLTRNPNERWTVEQCMNSDFLKPKAVSRAFVKDLVYSAVNFGCHSKEAEISDEVYEKLVQTVLRQIEDLNYA